MASTVRFQLDANIYDPEVLFANAMTHATTVDGISEDLARELLRPEGEIDLAACVQMLLDPSVLAGGSILESRAEVVEE